MKNRKKVIAHNFANNIMQNFQASKKKKKKRKLQPLRLVRRRVWSGDEEAGDQVNASPHSPLDTDAVVAIALAQAQAEKIIEETNYDEYDDYDVANDDANGDDNNGGNDGNGDGDNFEADEEEAVDAKEEIQEGEEEDGEEEQGGAEQERLAGIATCLAGFADYLKSAAGGFKSEVDTKLAVKRGVAMLEGTYSRRNAATLLVATKVAVFAWIFSLVENEYPLITEYLKDLARNRGLKPNTIKTYLTSSIVPLFVWHRLFSLVIPQPSPDAHARLHLVFKGLVANYRKTAKLTKKGETMTVEELIANKQWPKGGMAELRAVFVEHLPSILEVFEGDKPYKHNSEFFKKFMAFLMWGELFSSFSTIHYSSLLTHPITLLYYSGLYVDTAQGRPGGIDALTLEDGYELRDHRKSSFLAINLLHYSAALFFSLTTSSSFFPFFLLGFVRVYGLQVFQDRWNVRFAACDARRSSGPALRHLFGEGSAGYCAEGRGPCHRASLPQGEKGWEDRARHQPRQARPTLRTR